MEKEENFITSWKNLFEKDKTAMLCGVYLDSYKEEKDLLTNYKIVQRFPEHVKNNHFWADCIEKQCFAVRINPACFEFFPENVKSQRSLITTVLTSSYSCSSYVYNTHGYFHQLPFSQKEKIGYLNLALIYHPYTYCGLDTNLKSEPKIIRKLMQGLLCSKVSCEGVIKILKEVPLPLLKNYLSEPQHCEIFSEIIFEDNEFESIDFWNKIKSYLVGDEELKDLFPYKKHCYLSEEIKQQKTFIRQTYIHLRHKRLSLIPQKENYQLNKI